MAVALNQSGQWTIPTGEGPGSNPVSDNHSLNIY